MLGMLIPSDMDRKSFTDFFEEEYKLRRPASTDERKMDDVASNEYGYSEEEECVRLKLEALGYL